MQSFMKRLIQHRDQLSQLEKQVLDYIIRYPKKLVHLKLEEVAKEMYISTATISRTCKRLGFQGFQDFKLQLHLNIRDDAQGVSQGISESLSFHVKRYEKDIHEVLNRNPARNMRK